MTSVRRALLDAISAARTALADERRAFLEGTYADLPRITEQKTRLLDALEQGAGSVKPDPEVRSALELVISDSRRNEQIIAAALQGLRSARRRIKAIAETSGGAVAYTRDGQRISSAADAGSHSRSA